MKIALCLLLLVLLGVVASGCQTFSLTHEEWLLQQQGQYANPETGKVVDVIGTLGALGVTAAAVAGALK